MAVQYEQGRVINEKGRHKILMHNPLSCTVGADRIYQLV
jgi:hypothetical protein